MSAHYYGNELKKTQRFQLGELLGGAARHFLLMTATPHNARRRTSRPSSPCSTRTASPASIAPKPTASTPRASCGG